jgi:hypothetical protein
VIIWVLGITLLWFYLPFGIPDRFRIIVLPAFMVAGACWLVEVFRTRIELHSDRLTMISGVFSRSRAIARNEIELVKSEKGCRAALRLRDGTWVKLPKAGLSDRKCAATVRAWLRRTEAAE